MSATHSTSFSSRATTSRAHPIDDYSSCNDNGTQQHGGMNDDDTEVQEGESSSDSLDLDFDIALPARGDSSRRRPAC